MFFSEIMEDTLIVSYMCFPMFYSCWKKTDIVYRVYIEAYISYLSFTVNISQN